MPYNVNTPERQAKIAQYWRMVERTAIEWREEYRKPLEELREKKKKEIPDQDE
ncbi:MAG: hypothetical protein KJ737_07115 [Proteobacteria bacterium]|nr:hypothetical protein [Pseudomonadota bacterium]